MGVRAPIYLSLSLLSACSLVTSLDELGGDGFVPRPDGGVDAAADADAASSVDAAPEAAGPSLVSGTVVDEFGNPVSGAIVAIDANNQTTDGTGKFSFVAPATYSVLVVVPTASTVSGKRVRQYAGLTTRSPSLEVPGALRSSLVTFGVSGASFPLTGNERIVASFTPTTKTGMPNALFFSAASTQLSVPWTGANVSSGQIQAWDVTMDGAGFPSSWKGASSPTAYSFTDGAPATVALTLASLVNTTPFSGTIDYSGAIGVTGWVGFGAVGGTRSIFGVLGGSLTTINFPVVVGASLSLLARGGAPTSIAYAWKHNITGLKPTASIKLPTGDFAPTSPANAATGVDVKTAFSWPLVASSVYVLTLTCGASAPYTYLAEIITAATSVNLPLATSLGVTLPTGTACGWVVWAYAPAASADDFVGPAGWSHRLGFFDGTQDGTAFLSTKRTLTTK